MSDPLTASPSLAIAKAMKGLRGRRTGVAFGKRGAIAQDNVMMEDVDQFWQSAKTPLPDENDGKQKQSKKQPLKANNRQDPPSVRRSLRPRFSLPGVGNEKQQEEATSTAVASGQKQKAHDLLARLQTGRALSPSDMSRVSTAPPSPAAVEGGEEVPVSPPEHVRGSAVPEQEDLAVVTQAQQQEHEETTTATVTSPEFPAVDDDHGFAEEDDLVPPPPPPEEENEQDEDHLVTATAPDSQDDDVDFPTTVDDYHEVQENDDDGDDDDENKMDDVHDHSGKKDKLDNAQVDDSHELNGDDDDDKSGNGFFMVNDEQDTPDSVREERARLEQEQKKKKAKRKKRKSTSSEGADEETVTPAPKKRPKKKKKVTYSSPIGYPAGNREYQAVPVSDYKDSPDDTNGRRSRRAKFRPLAFWKNERPVYEAHNEEGELGEAMGCMPVVAGILTALPTPYKKRQITHVKQKTAKKSRGASHSGSESERDGELTPFDSTKLRKKFDFINGEHAEIWDEANDKPATLKVVSYGDSMVYSELPMSAHRKKSEGKVKGQASQAFNEPSDDKFVGYISGNLVLPPRGIKDPESSGVCTLVFTILHAQPGAMELAIGDPHETTGRIDPKTSQRFLLGPGDMFRVPPGNSYRLQNHSKTTDCSISWTIIRSKENEPLSPSSSSSTTTSP